MATDLANYLPSGFLKGLDSVFSQDVGQAAHLLDADQDGLPAGLRRQAGTAFWSSAQSQTVMASLMVSRASFWSLPLDTQPGKSVWCFT